MNPAEYRKLDEIDRDHWFYRGKREIVRYWIRRYRLLHSNDLLIDAGCGTGTMLVEMSAACRVLGLDDSEESMALARPRVEAAGGAVMKTDLSAVPLEDGGAAVVLLLDVLEHLDEPSRSLDEMIRLVEPGGLIVITVPALEWLWSDWDVALHHRRRYTRKDLLVLVQRSGVELLRCTYINTAALLPIVVVRFWRRLFAPAPGRPRAEDRVPPRMLNAILRWCFVTPACRPWLRPPLGVSLLAVLRRTEDAAGSTAAAGAAMASRASPKPTQEHSQRIVTERPEGVVGIGGVGKTQRLRLPPLTEIPPTVPLAHRMSLSRTEKSPAYQSR